MQLRVFRMSSFVSRINRITGNTEWDFMGDNYDYKQEIARSAYADMLHDTERNQLYYKALEKAIVTLKKKGQSVHVLDIGTGTGLLSMMAAKLGADTVTACEAFKPMAECASKIIIENGFADKIKLVPKRSTDLKVGKGNDLPRKANVLVTEVFDTELIGEGAIGTFTHAHKDLLENDCIVIPSYANMYAQIVTSDLVRGWNQIREIAVSDSKITAPNTISRCGGAPSLHDLQLDQLPMDTFNILSKPKRVFRFDFTGKSLLPFENTSILDCTMINTGCADAVFMWWDLEMDQDGDIILSCAPRWAHPTPDRMQWRDHWMQAIYYPYNQLNVEKGDRIKLISKHDEYSLWFDVAIDSMLDCKDSSVEKHPVCTCAAHITYGRTRMGMINDSHRNNLFKEILTQNITRDTTCLCISDGSLLPLIAAKLGAKHVYTVETNKLCRRVITDFIQHNALQEKITVLNDLPEKCEEYFLQTKIDIIIGEPIFQTSVLPWDNMCFWYQAHKLCRHLSEHGRILPVKMVVNAIAVNYADLWKIRADVGLCEGFSLQEFDKIIQTSSEEVDENVEPHPLWEYPCTAAGDWQTLVKVDFTIPAEKTASVNTCISLHVTSQEACNGVALWVEFDFGDGHVISSGPRQAIRIGEKILWDYHCKQGVHLFDNKQSSTCSEVSLIDVHVNFVPTQGKLEFHFTPKSK